MSGSACHDGPFNNQHNNDEPVLHKSGSAVDVNQATPSSSDSSGSMNVQQDKIDLPCGDVNMNTSTPATSCDISLVAGEACASTSTDTPMAAEQPNVANISDDKEPVSVIKAESLAPMTAPPVTPETSAKEIENCVAIPVASSPKKRKIKPGRCGVCRKKLGLTGFKCQCEVFFCAAHRMPEAHECEFDFKSSGRERLATANKAVRAEKVVKI